MSILTKICVVLVLVVSVAASGAFLRIVSVQRSWKDAYNQQLNRAKIANHTAANMQVALKDRLVDLEKAQTEIGALKKSLTDANDAHAAYKTEAAHAAAVRDGDTAALKLNFTGLEKQLQASLLMKSQILKEKADLAAAVKTANEIARELKKEFDAATVQIARLTRMGDHYVLLIRELEAEKTEMRLEIEKGPQSVAGKGGVTPVTAAGQAVSGKVTAVLDGVASINIGRARGIEKKMVLKVFRNGKFVSHLRIDLVQPDAAAGVILDKQLEVMQGDQVATDLK